MKEENKVQTYQDVINDLKKYKQEDIQKNHILLGNGFNKCLDINIDYENIFQVMKLSNPLYGKIQEKRSNSDFNVEELIGELVELLKENVCESEYYDNYLENKIKNDFMKAVSIIVRKEVSNIYKKRNSELLPLISNIDNYFTLNYDTFLYQILMRFKESEIINENLFQTDSTLEVFGEERKKYIDTIYTEVENAYETGKLTVQVGKEHKSVDLKDPKKVTKSAFQNIVAIYFKEQNIAYKVKDIEIGSSRLWDKVHHKITLENLNDGFIKDRFIKESKQNIFFLHGSFHIYKEYAKETSKQVIKKIIQVRDKPFYSQLEKIVQAAEKKIVCILTDKSEKKVKQIMDNCYTKKCFLKLRNLSGCMVIIGSSFATNDKHIFKEIKESNINKIYIPINRNTPQKEINRRKDFFKNKEIVLYNYNTINKLSPPIP